MKLFFGVIFGALIAFGAGPAVLWKDPGPIESLDLAGGPGGRASAPQPPFVFDKEETRGTAPKVVVRDGRGVVWMVKFGPEVKAETFATRIAWASGYFVEPTYYVREGYIEGARALGRAGQFIDQGNRGHFRDARFELRNDQVYTVVSGSHWSLDEKSLKGTKELSGLKLVLMLVSNWDAKPENFSVVMSGGQRYFAITDWGATMGRAGDFTLRSKWDCVAFTKQSEYFVDGVDNGYVGFTFHGKAADVITNDVRVEDVKWFLNRMRKLSDEQIRAALAASGATAEEATCFTAALRKRLQQLAAAASGTLNSPVTRSETVTKTRSVTTPKQ